MRPDPSGCQTAPSAPSLDFLRARRDDILCAAERHGAITLKVFGSVARGEATPISDIDFLVEMEAGRSLLDLAGLACDLEDLLRFRVDVATEKSLRDRFRDHVLAEAVGL